MSATQRDEFDELPDDKAMAALTLIIEEYDKVDVALAKYKELVVRGEKRLKQLIEEVIPEALDKCNQDECVIKSLGIRVAIKEDHYANIPAQGTIEKCKDDDERQQMQERRDKAMTWVNENCPDIITRKFEIGFSRSKEDQQLANKFERDLAQRKKPLPVLRSETVNHMTLQKTVRELLEEGHPVPRDLLGVYTKRVARITRRE